uniref:Replication factor A C-terminal domain-containing protein n=1 Tax=Lactuca sativa TaxID=4236 RepID=A0A9R1VQG9_LACSA|nr:hypothetical protein LSAT_V11C400213850 [Lactuca sativa]
MSSDHFNTQNMNVEIQNAQKLFMIPVRVQDHTGSITLTMFEQDAKKLLKISVKDLIAKTARLGFGTGLYPSEINVLKDMKLAFIVSISKYNLERNNNQYSILRSSDDDNLIQYLEKKTLSDVIHNRLMLVPLIMNLKITRDAISQTDDNVTLTNVFKSTATSPKKKFDTSKGRICFGCERQDVVIKGYKSWRGRWTGEIFEGEVGKVIDFDCEKNNWFS